MPIGTIRSVRRPASCLLPVLRHPCGLQGAPPSVRRGLGMTPGGVGEKVRLKSYPRRRGQERGAAATALRRAGRAHQRSIPAFEEALKKANKPYTLYIYEGAQHAFNPLGSTM